MSFWKNLFKRSPRQNDRVPRPQPRPEMQDTPARPGIKAKRVRMAPLGYDDLVLVPLTYGRKTIHVATDYIKKNGVRVPLDWNEAQRLCHATGMRLPTHQLVDFIWENADLRLPPTPLSPTNTGNPRFYDGGRGGMTDPKWVPYHDDIIEQQLQRAGHIEQTDLLAGHKKDLVQGARRGKVAIYGWHKPNGQPIQSLSNVHGATYKDYSHGVRLVLGI